MLDDALAANLELRAGEAAIAQRLAGLDQARARYLPAHRHRRALQRRGRRPHHRIPGRRPAEPGVRHARRAAGGVGPAAALPAHREPEHHLPARQRAGDQAGRWSSRCTSRASRPRSTRTAQRSTAPAPTSPRCARASSATPSRPTTSGSPRSRRCWCSTPPASWRARTSRQREPVPQRQDHPRPRAARRGRPARDRAAAHRRREPRAHRAGLREPAAQRAARRAVAARGDRRAGRRAIPQPPGEPPRRPLARSRDCCSSSPPGAAPELRSLDAAIAGGAGAPGPRARRVPAAPAARRREPASRATTTASARTSGTRSPP